MEFLPETRRFKEKTHNEDDIAYERRKLRWELENYRLIASRVNWLLDRVNVTSESSEDGTRYMKVEFIEPGNTRNDNGNWRLLLMPDNVVVQQRVSGTWTTRTTWYGASV